MQMIQKFLKRLVVWALESLAETFLLGCLFGTLLFPNFISMLPGGVLSSVFMIAFVLIFHGFYVATALSGLVWRSQKSWLNPAIATALFGILVHIAFVRSKSDLTPEARAIELPFQLGGACIVFACTFFGGWCLRKWTKAAWKQANGPDPQQQRRTESVV
jgi:hypothetical protein